MPIRAQITVNGSPGSDDDVPINTAVLLGNNGLGSEATYAWSLVSQPDGAADALSATGISAPQLVPKKEGTYMLHLVVSDGLGNTEVDQVVVGVRLLKTRGRIPAPGEAVEDDAGVGWHSAVAGQLATLDGVRADPGLFVGQIGAGGMSANMVCRITGTATIKSGLPGEEKVPTLVTAPATGAGPVSGLLAVLVAAVDGGATSNGKLAYFRWQGSVYGLAGAPTTGNSVFVSDTASLSLAQGTVLRTVGRVTRSGGGTYDIFLHGGGPPAVDIEDAAYLIEGSTPSSLPGAIDTLQSATTRVFGYIDNLNTQEAIALALKHLISGGGGAGANGVGVGLSFHSPSGAGTMRELARIIAKALDVTDGSEKGAIVFMTKPSGSAPVEIARLTDDGRLLIGVTAAVGAEKLRVNGNAYINGLAKCPTTPAADDDLARKGYVDAEIAAAIPAANQPETFYFGASNGGGAPATAYLYPGFGAATASSNEIKLRMAQPGTFTAMYVRNRTAPTTAAGNPVETYTLRKNGADTALVVDLAAAATSGSDTTGTHTVTVAAGDDISISCLGHAGIISGSLDVVVSLKFQPT